MNGFAQRIFKRSIRNGPSVCGSGTPAEATNFSVNVLGICRQGPGKTERALTAYMTEAPGNGNDGIAACLTHR